MKTTAAALLSLVGVSHARVLNQLVFEDNFDGNQLNTSKWDIEVNCWGGGNSEKQCYTARPENVYVSGGALHLRAIRGDYRGTPLPPAGDCTLNNENSCEWTQPYTSGRVRTLNSNFGSWKYGRFEIRARLPKGRGLWPAIWMLPTDNVFGGWAASGEIDIMESRGQESDRVEGTQHYSSAWPNNRYKGSGMRTFSNIPDFSTAFHTFAIQWEENFITWSVDGTDFYTSISDRNWCESPGCPYKNNGEPWNQRFHMLLNLAVGGNYLAGPDGDDYLQWQHQELVIDSVKVYTESGAPEPPLPTCTAGGLDPYLNGPYVPCCQGTSDCLADWGSNGNYHYLCLTAEDCAAGPQPPTFPPGTPECTVGGKDPYMYGPKLECCDGLKECVNDWAGNGNWFYLCLLPGDCPTVV
jgi:beta-glucanase (GH16 family)